MTESQENLNRLLEYQEYGHSLNRIISFGQKDEGCKIDDIIKCLIEEQDEKVKQSNRFHYCIAFVLLNKEKNRPFISPTTNLQPLEDQYPQPLDLMKSSAETSIPSSDFLEYWESEIGQLGEGIDE